MVETLNELTRLRDVRFGRPRPRHGLKLLHWFAKDCLSFDTNNDMFCECDPKDGDFGFHLYENRPDEYGRQLLPESRDMSYYVVGNLNSPGVDGLPDYVTEDKFSGEDDSNTERIIVSLDDQHFDKVYVTQHVDQSNYDPIATYRISRGLLMIIRRMSLEDFLMKTGYTQTFTPPPAVAYTPHTILAVGPESTVTFDSESSDSEEREPPVAQHNHTSVPIPETEPVEKGFWESFCTIL